MRLLFLCLLYLFLTLPGHAQERVRNVRIRVVDSTSLEIRYDLLTTQPRDSIYLQIRSRLRGALRILPKFLRGDVGVGVTAGTDRRIIWDALANGYFLNEEIQATVLVKAVPAMGRSQSPKPVAVKAPTVTTPKSKTVAPKPTEPVVITTPKVAEPTAPVVVVAPTQPPVSTTLPPAQVQPTAPQSATTGVDSVPAPKPHRRYAGPAWALLSAVAPGIGNVFVQMPKPKVGLRPVVTVLCYGAVVYGLMERQKANDTYTVYEQQKNMTDGEPYYQTANGHHHRYFLATRGALLVTAADVVLTFIKGIRNSQVTKKTLKIQGITVRPGWQAGQPTAVVQYSF